MKIDGINVNAKVSTEAVMAACEARMTTLDDIGFCILCGCEHYGIEPDACKYTCEACGADAVYGCEELLIMMA